MKKLIKRKDKPQFLPCLKAEVSLRKMMKIKAEHLAHMKAAIDKFIESSGGKESLIEKYETGNFPRSEQVKHLNERFYSDVLYNAGLNPFVCEKLYDYMNDSHIQTALKSILPTLTRRY